MCERSKKRAKFFFYLHFGRCVRGRRFPLLAFRVIVSAFRFFSTLLLSVQRLATETLEALVEQLRVDILVGRVVVVGREERVVRILHLFVAMFVEVVVRPSHDQQPRQDVYEDASDPRRHCVGLRCAKVHVQHDDRHTYTTNGIGISHNVKTFRYRKVARNNAINQKKASKFNILKLLEVALRPSHGQQPREDEYEDASGPGHHCVCLRRAKVRVQHDDHHTYTTNGIDINHNARTFRYRSIARNNAINRKKGKHDSYR